jgi:hypothetical protein
MAENVALPFYPPTYPLQAHAANILTVLFDNWGLLGTPERLNPILQSHGVPRLLDLTRSDHVEGDAQRAALRCLVALSVADARALRHVRGHGGESTAKWVLNHPAGNRQQAQESQRLAGALVAVLLEGKSSKGSSSVLSPVQGLQPTVFYGGETSPDSPSSLGSLRSFDTASTDSLDSRDAASPSFRPVEELSVKELKDLLSGAGISSKGCVERADLVELARKYGLAGATTSPSGSVKEEVRLTKPLKRRSVASTQPDVSSPF